MSDLAATLNHLFHPNRSLRRLRRSNLTFGKLHIRELVTLQFALGKLPLQKYLNPWEIYVVISVFQKLNDHLLNFILIKFIHA